MTLPWDHETHGMPWDAVRLPWTAMGCLQMAMGLPWDCHKAMTLPWDHEAMALPWHCHGAAMGLHWDCHEAMTLPWDGQEDMKLP